MTYYHLPHNHSLAIKCRTFLEKENASREEWFNLAREIGASHFCGHLFSFPDNKKPNKHWKKHKKQKWDWIAYTPSDKTPEGRKLIERLREMPEITNGGIYMMWALFGDNPNVVEVTDTSFHDKTLEFVREHGQIGFKIHNDEVYIQGSDFWLFGEKEEVKEITNIEYRNLP